MANEEKKRSETEKKVEVNIPEPREQGMKAAAEDIVQKIATLQMMQSTLKKLEEYSGDEYAHRKVDTSNRYTHLTATLNETLRKWGGVEMVNQWLETSDPKHNVPSDFGLDWSWLDEDLRPNFAIMEEGRERRKNEMCPAREAFADIIDWSNQPLVSNPYESYIVTPISFWGGLKRMVAYLEKHYPNEDWRTPLEGINWSFLPERLRL